MINYLCKKFYKGEREIDVKFIKSNWNVLYQHVWWNF